MAKYLVTGPHRNEHGGRGWGVVDEGGYTVIPPILSETMAWQCAQAISSRELTQDEIDGNCWVSVADGLPEKDTSVIVAFTTVWEAESWPAHWDGERFLDIDAACWPNDPAWFSDSVAFWRHYPKPPASMMQDTEGDDA